MTTSLTSAVDRIVGNIVQIGPAAGDTSVYVTDAPFYAAGDGVTDDTAAFQAALNSGAHLVKVPWRRFLIAGNLRIPFGVHLKGDATGPFDIYIGNPIKTAIGPTLLLTNTYGIPVYCYYDGVGRFANIVLDGFCQISDLIIAYPNQTVPSVGGTYVPVQYPWAVSVHNTIGNPYGFGTYIRRLTIMNSYRGVQLWGGRNYLEDCYIGALVSGVVSDGSADRNTLRNIRMGDIADDAYQIPGLSSNMDAFTNQNLVGYEFIRSDAFLGENLSLEGGNVAYQFRYGYAGSIGPYGLMRHIYSEGAKSKILHCIGPTGANGIHINGYSFVAEPPPQTMLQSEPGPNGEIGAALTCINGQFVGASPSNMPVLNAAGYFYVNGYGVDGAGPLGGPLTVPTVPSSGPFTYYSRIPNFTDVYITGGSGVVVFLGNSTSSPIVGSYASGGNIHVRLPPGGSVTVTYNSGSPPALYPIGA